MEPVEKRWVYSSLEQKGGLYNRILKARGWSKSDLSPILDDPSNIHDMDKAIDILRNAIKKNKKIGIYGDYDVDGIAATALLTRALRRAGANVIPLIPNRVDGFGLSPSAINQLSSLGVQVVVTVDNGSDRIDVVSRAQKLNMEVIVTDHHPISLDKMASPEALVNPRHPYSQYPFLDLCGAGVAFTVALCMAYPPDGGKGLIEPPWDLVPLAALATVADVVPVRGANRLLLKNGLSKFPKITGLAALMEIAQFEEVYSRDVGFEIAPRINAAGRMGDAKEALRLLLSDDPLECHILALQLNKLNEERKILTERFVEQAKERIEKSGEFLENQKALIIYDSRWSLGIVGLIAAKLAELYCRPVFVGGSSPKDNLIHGSARTGALLPSGSYVSCSRILDDSRKALISGGGHEVAAGFVLEQNNFELFKELIEAGAAKLMQDIPLINPVRIDVLAGLPTLAECQEVLSLEPTGKDFETPTIATLGAKILKIRGTSREKKVLLSKDGVQCFAVGNKNINLVAEGSTVDVAYTIEKDRRGDCRLRLVDLVFVA